MVTTQQFKFKIVKAEKIISEIEKENKDKSIQPKILDVNISLIEQYQRLIRKYEGWISQDAQMQEKGQELLKEWEDR